MKWTQENMDSDFYNDREVNKYTKRIKSKNNKNGKDKRKWRQKRFEKRGYE